MADTEAFPGTCGLCGRVKVLDEDRTVPSAAAGGGVEMRFFDVCANPDCPGNDSDLVKAADGP